MPAAWKDVGNWGFGHERCVITQASANLFHRRAENEYRIRCLHALHRRKGNFYLPGTPLVLKCCDRKSQSLQITMKGSKDFIDFITLCFPLDTDNRVKSSTLSGEQEDIHYLRETTLDRQV